MDENETLTIRLEDLLTDPSCINQLIEFLGLPVDVNEFSKSLAKPRNVYRPEHIQLSADEIAIFKEICSKTMTRYGYEIETESHVNYG
jgi:hypothetical protein